MLRPVPVASNVPIVRKRRAPSAPALPVGWARVLQAERWIQAVCVAEQGRRIYAASFAAPLGRGLRRRPEPRDQAVFALDQDGCVLWRDACSHYEGVHALAVSEDGQTVAAGGWYSSEPWAGFVAAWTSEGVRLLTWNQAPSRIEAVALSADGSTLVAVGEALYLFHRQPGEPFASEPSTTIRLSQGFAPTLALDASGRWIATADGEGSVHLFEHPRTSGDEGSIAERRYAWRSPAAETETRVALSADGDSLLVGTGDGSLHMFNRPTFIATNRPIWTYPVLEAGAPTSLTITAEGEELVALYERGEGGSVYLLGNHDGAPHLRWVKPTKSTPTAAALLRDRWVAVADANPRGTSGDFYLFEAATGLLAGAHSCAAPCWTVALDEQSSRLLGGSDDGSLYAFELPL